MRASSSLGAVLCQLVACLDSVSRTIEHLVLGIEVGCCSCIPLGSQGRCLQRVVCVGHWWASFFSCSPLGASSFWLLQAFLCRSSWSLEARPTGADGFAAPFPFPSVRLVTPVPTVPAARTSFLFVMALAVESKRQSGAGH